MLRITLGASEMVDGKKVFCGSVENFPVAETVSDIMDLCDGDKPEMTEAQVVSSFNGGNKVRAQAALRSPAKKKPDSPAVAAFKKLSDVEQAAALAQILGQ